MFSASQDNQQKGHVFVCPSELITLLPPLVLEQFISLLSYILHFSTDSASPLPTNIRRLFFDSAKVGLNKCHCDDVYLEYHGGKCDDKYDCNFVYFEAGPITASLGLEQCFQ